MKFYQFQTPKKQAICKPQIPVPPAKKYGIITTKKQYYTREWELDEFMSECNKEEAEALRSDEPMLELPKWSEKEFSGGCTSDSAENVSDSEYDKRHGKLECNEKRRKKWDVQRLREQKTIERLRRRHCKDEYADQHIDTDELQSFYPSFDQIEFIEITEDLPVQAFGEGIPDIPATEFTLPWANKRLTGVELQLGSDLPSSFVFLKKRKRNYSTLTNKRLARIRDPATLITAPAPRATQNHLTTATSPTSILTTISNETPPVPPPEE